MLPKGIIGEENFFLGAVGHHAVGPVKHGRGYELKGTLTNA